VSRSVGTAISLVALLAIAALAVISVPSIATRPGSSGSPEQSLPAIAIDASHQLVPTEPLPSPALPTLPPTESPIADTELERSDLFWDALISGETPDPIESLAGGFRDADLVVVGRFTAIAFEHNPALDELGDFPIASATFAIDEVLKGRPETPVEGTITLRSGPVSDPQLLEQLMPTHQHLVFLWYVPSWMERLDRPPEEQAESRYHYQLMNGGQAVIRNIGGTIRVIDPRNPERFPNGFEGQPFDVALETIREVAPAPEASSAPQ